MDLPYRIIFDAPGRLCNRFWSILDLLAWALVKNRKIIILLWNKDFAYYPQLLHSKYVVAPTAWGGQFSVINNILGSRLLRGIYKLPTSRQLGLVQGWQHRADSRYYPEVMEAIRMMFRPDEQIIKQVDSLLLNYLENGNRIVGVHIRRGDYKEWQNGRYYYEIEDYIEIMRQIEGLYGQGKTVFYIASDEQFCTNDFAGFRLVNDSQNSTAVDLYALTKCYRIIGPLSTFSRWASLVGGVPLRFVEKGDVITSDDEFSVIKDFYHFEDGREILNLSDRN